MVKSLSSRGMALGSIPSTKKREKERRKEGNKGGGRKEKRKEGRSEGRERGKFENNSSGKLNPIISGYITTLSSQKLIFVTEHSFKIWMSQGVLSGTAQHTSPKSSFQMQILGHRLHQMDQKLPPWKCSSYACPNKAFE